MKITAKTKIEDLSKKKFKKLFKYSIRFCEQNLGFNKRKKLPLEVLWSKNTNEDCYGWYDAADHTIQINANCETVSDFTRTMVHEWTHSLQPVLSKYAKLYKQYGYDNHPMEIEAYAAEKTWNRKMLNYLKSI